MHHVSANYEICFLEVIMGIYRLFPISRLAKYRDSTSLTDTILIYVCICVVLSVPRLIPVFPSSVIAVFSWISGFVSLYCCCGIALAVIRWAKKPQDRNGKRKNNKHSRR